MSGKSIEDQLNDGNRRIRNILIILVSSIIILIIAILTGTFDDIANALFDRLVTIIKDLIS